MISSSSWPLVDRAAAQLEVDGHMRGRSASRWPACRCTAGWRRPPAELVDVGEVAQGLDAARSGAGADGDQDLDWSRTWRIRSASAAVVMEPSTRDRSYGPGAPALEASRKCAIRTWPARASSSSSQSSRVSWQPSQEANFHTARLGGLLVRRQSSQLPDGQQRLGRGRSRRPGRRGRPAAGRAGSARTGRCRTSCSAPATPGCRSAGNAPSHQRRAQNRIIDLWPAQEGGGPGRVQRQRAQRLGDETDRRRPSRPRPVDRSARRRRPAWRPTSRAGRGTGTRPGCGRRR